MPQNGNPMMKLLVKICRYLALLALWFPLKLVRALSLLVIIVSAFALAEQHPDFGDTVMFVAVILTAAAVRVALPAFHRWLRLVGR